MAIFELKKITYPIIQKSKSYKFTQNKSGMMRAFINILNLKMVMLFLKYLLCLYIMPNS